MVERIRLTEIAITDIKNASEATLRKGRGGYRIDLSNGSKEVKLKDKNGLNVIFSSKVNAKRTLLRHNADIQIALKSTFEE